MASPSEASVLTSADYNALGPTYEAAYAQSEPLKHVLHRFLSHLSPTSEVLDLGCGTGKPVAHTLGNAGHIVHGVDWSEAMLELSRTACPSGQFEKADILQYEPSKQYDGIVAMFSMFEMGRDQIQELSRKWAGWVKPGGVVLIGGCAAEDFGQGGIWDEDGMWKQGIVQKFLGTWLKMGLFSKEGWQRLLSNMGFEILYAGEGEFEPAKESGFTGTEKHWFVIGSKG